MIAPLLSLLAAAKQLFGGFGEFFQRNAKALLIAVAAACAGYVLIQTIKTHTELAVAQTTIERQADQLEIDAATISHLRTIANARIASAETFGRVIASLDAAHAASLERIENAPLTENCLRSPAIGVALDGMRNARDAAAAARLPARDTR